MTINIILVKPQLGENVGMVARAMLNFGQINLRIVAPRDGWPNEKAYKTASGADFVIDNVKVFQTTKEAVSDLNYVMATTARDRDMVKQFHTPKTAAKEINQKINEGKKIGILFGAERTGLENDDIALSEAIITYPTNPDFSSLNLAQAVLIMAYELNKIDQKEPRLKKPEHTPFAPKQDVDRFLNQLNDNLENAGFFKSEDAKPALKKNIENIIVRIQPTSQELNTLYGIVKSIQHKD